MSEAINVNPTGLYEAALGQKNRAYYIEKFEKFDQEGIGIKVSWNWPAFFFGGIWALYRKMYGWFFGWWFVVTVLTVFKTIPNAAIQLTLAAVVMACWLGFAVFANSFYHSKIKHRISSANKPNSDVTYVRGRLAANAGIHSWVPIVFGAIPVIGIVTAVALPLYLDKGKSQLTPSSAEAAKLKLDETEDIKSSVRTALFTDASDIGAPVPEFKDTQSRLSYLRWLGNMDERLKERMPELLIRREFLQTVWYESKRAGLDTALVLGLIETTSSFRKFNVSDLGARGYMGVNQKWPQKIGDGDVSKLFHMQTNLRFGCVVLRHFLDKREGNVALGLVDYFDENLSTTQDSKAREDFVAVVLANRQYWQFSP